jgi:hypothetical protein
MHDVVTALTVNGATYFAQVAKLAPLIGIAIIVSFGLGILSAIIDGLNQGKVTMTKVGRWSEGIDGIKSGKYHG